MNEEEARLIELIKLKNKNSADAFNKLLAPQRPRMYNAAFGIMKNHDDAEDRVQDAMLRIFRSIKNFRGDSAFSTWVFRVTINTCLDELRKRKKLRNNVSLEAMIDVGWMPPDPNDDPSGITVRREAMSSLAKAIMELPSDMRSAIILRDIYGFSYNEISEILEINVGTVKSRISRGREKLCEYVRKHPELFDPKDV